ncbi:MAG: T9SS type A sorting domain-containing protein [Bacteroidota bacterium]|nr:T9SS type A sorting domain-containing protein [Bacteroidota bacterium]
MRLFPFLLFFLLIFTSVSELAAQANASINLLTLNSGLVNLGGNVNLQVTVGNTGPISPIGVNKVRAQISIPIAIASAAPNIEQTGLPAGWIILSNTGGVITVCNGTDIIPVGAQRQVLIKIRGDAVGGPSTIAGQLTFGPGTGICTGLGTLSGDLPADNISQSTIQVLAVLPCTLSVSASAGSIICNGGTTTLTAAPTGASGTVEYNLNGGSFQSSNTFTVNAAGSPYTIIAREVTNPTCTATSAPVIVTHPAAVPAPVVNIIQPTCTLATGTITITSPTGGFIFSFDGGSYTAYPVGGYVASPGAHTLRAQNSNNCLSAITNITIDPQPLTPGTPTVSIVQPTCTVATGTITITSSTIGLTFSFDGAAFAAYPSGGFIAVAGSHTLVAQNTAGCISAVANISVDTQPATPAAPTVNIVQPGCTIPNGTITITSSTSGLVFSFDGGPYIAYPAGGYVTGPGAHTLIAQNSSGCTSAVTNIVVDTQPVTPSAPIVSVVQPTCTTANGTITITSPTSGLNFSFDGGAYAIYPPGGYLASPGSHTLTAQNPSGCISTMTSIIIDPQPVTPAAPEPGTITQPTCTISTGSVVLNGLPFGNWIINPGAVAGNTSSTTITGLAAGTYNFTVTNAAGCTSSVSADVVINTVLGAPPPPVVSIVHPTCLVSTGTITITSSTTGLSFSLDGGTYAAYPPGGYIVSAGQHTLAAQNESNCISPVLNITVDPQPVTPSAPTISVVQPTCTVATGTVTVTSSTIGLTFSFDGAAFASYPVGGYIAGPGQHTLTVQNSSGCLSAIATITVNQPPVTPTAPVIGLITQPTCAVLTGSVVLTDLPAGNWVINPGAITGNTSSTTITGLVPGTYNFTVTNAAGCTSAASANVMIVPVSGLPDAPTVNVLQPTCATATGIITITSPVTGLTFSLDGGPYASYPAGGYIVTSGSHTLTAQNAGSCVSAITNIIVDPQPLTPAAPVVTIIHSTCTVSTGTLTVTSVTTGLTFSLDGSPFNIYPVTGYIVVPGAHTLVAKNAAGCTSSVTNIIVDAQPLTPASPTVSIVQPTCAVATGTITISSSTTGLTFSLDGGAYAAYPAGGYTVSPGAHTFTAQNAAGCVSAVVNTNIDVQPISPAAPTVSIVQPTCSVATGRIMITSVATGLSFSLDGGVYSAYPGGGYIVAAGSHTLTAQNAAGCISAVTTININVQPGSPTATLTTGVILCFGGTTTINVGATGGTAPYQYSLNGGTIQASNIFSTGAGVHSIVVRDANLCTGTASISITQPTVITASLTTGTISCNGGTVTLTVTATGGTGTKEYRLNGGPFQPGNTFVVGVGIYTVSVRDINGCSVTTPALNLTQPAVLTVSATADRIMRCGGTTEISVIVSGGTVPYQSTGRFIRGPGTWVFPVIDAAGCTASATITIEAPGCINPRVYPNPAGLSITVDHDEAAAGSSMQVYDIRGSLVLSKAVPQNAFQTTIDLSRIATGSYVLVYWNGSEKKTVLFEKTTH